MGFWSDKLIQSSFLFSRKRLIQAELLVLVQDPEPFRDGSDPLLLRTSGRFQQLQGPVLFRVLLPGFSLLWLDQTEPKRTQARSHSWFWLSLVVLVLQPEFNGSGPNSAEPNRCGPVKRLLNRVRVGRYRKGAQKVPLGPLDFSAVSLTWRSTGSGSVEPVSELGPGWTEPSETEPFPALRVQLRNG